MKPKEIIKTVTEIKFLTVAFLILSFIPLEQSCAPGNLLLFASPFIILLIRLKTAGKITRNDAMYAAVFVVMIIFVLLLANLTGCVKTWGIAQELPHEWKMISIDRIDSDGVVYVKAIRTVPIQLAEISVFVNGQPVKCSWDNSYISYIAPSEVRACSLGLNCNGNTTIEIIAPGNSDTASC